MRALFGKEYEMTIEEAVCYLKKQDLAALEVGTYKVNDDFYFMIQEYETKPAENCRLETHNCYADIQWIISGEEEIDTVSRTGLEADEEYDEKRDVAFWKEPEEMCQSILTTGSYAVLPPGQRHPKFQTEKRAIKQSSSKPLLRFSIHPEKVKDHPCALFQRKE